MRKLSEEEVEELAYKLHAKWVYEAVFNAARAIVSEPIEWIQLFVDWDDAIDTIAIHLTSGQTMEIDEMKFGYTTFMQKLGFEVLDEDDPYIYYEKDTPKIPDLYVYDPNVVYDEPVSFDDWANNMAEDLR